MNHVIAARGDQPDVRIYSAPGASTGSPKREDSFWGGVGDVPLLNSDQRERES